MLYILDENNYGTMEIFYRIYCVDSKNTIPKSNSMTSNRDNHKNLRIPEAEWAIKIKKGDKAAFNKLFLRYYDKLCQFVGHYVRDPDIAEDIVQEFFYKIWINRTTWNFTPNIVSYLYKAARNYSLNHLKNNKIKDKFLDDFNESFYLSETPEKELIDKEFNDRVHAVINELPEQCRIIFKMKKFDGLKYAEIAEIKNISVKTVETQMGRALKYLRKRLTVLLTVISL